VNIGAGARGGRTRGAHQGREHERGGQEPSGPCGIVEEESAELPLPLGRSSKTRDGIVEVREAKWDAWDAPEKAATRLLQINRDQGPESRGRRTPLLPRMVPRADAMPQPMPRRDSPPSPSPYHPIERGWGLLALQGHGTTWLEAETMVAWAKRRTWKGRHPVVARSHKVSQKGLTLGKAAMPAVAARWERHPAWPKYDMLLNPVPTSCIRKFFLRNRLKAHVASQRQQEP
jgi:hypothetical protein